MPRFRFTSETILLVASFFIATAVWLVAKQNDFENQIVGARVVARTPPKNMEIKINPPVINVSVQYPRTFSHLIHPEAFTIELKDIDENFASAQDFKMTPMTITLRNVMMEDLPNTVQATSLGKEFVTIAARLHTSPARIVGTLGGRPAEGYQLVHNPPQVEPEEVLLTGSPQKLADAGSEKEGVIILKTDPVSIEGKRENFLETTTVPLPEGLKYVVEDKLRVQMKEELEVQLHVVIGEEVRKKTIGDVPIAIKTFSENLSPVYTPTTASVTLEAPISMLKQLDRDSVMFIPSQPLEERVGYKADIAIEARFSGKIPPNIRDKASIVSFSPRSIRIEIVERNGNAPSSKEKEVTKP